MVYGLNVKPEHGYYVEVEPVDGDLGQVKLVDETDDGGYPPRGIPLVAGRAVRTEHLPSRMKWLDRKKHPIPDFDNGLLLNVSSKAKALIESIEPGVHQFVPVTYEDQLGHDLENRYFLFVGNRLDSMSADNPGMVLNRGIYWVPVSDLKRRGQEIPSGKDPDAPAKLIVSRVKIGPSHLWTEKHSSSGSTFISDELASAIAEAGLSGLKPSPVDTV